MSSTCTKRCLKCQARRPEFGERAPSCSRLPPGQHGYERRSPVSSLDRRNLPTSGGFRFFLGGPGICRMGGEVLGVSGQTLGGPSVPGQMAKQIAKKCLPFIKAVNERVLSWRPLPSGTGRIPWRRIIWPNIWLPCCFQLLTIRCSEVSPIGLHSWRLSGEFVASSDPSRHFPDGMNSSHCFFTFVSTG